MNSSSWSLRILAACLLAGVLAQSSLAQAEPGAEVPTALVRFHDLNLNSASGVRTLYGRIRLAAEARVTACGKLRRLPLVNAFAIGAKKCRASIPLTVGRH